MDGGRVDAGAQTHDQHRGTGDHGTVDHPAQVFRRDMAKRLTLRLQVIENGDFRRTCGRRKLGRVHHPIQVCHRGDTVLHRASGSDTDAGHFGAGLGQIILQHMGDVLPARLIFGIGKAANAVEAHFGAIRQGNAGVGTANVGKDGKGHALVLCVSRLRAGLLVSRQGAGEGVI